MSTLSRVIFSKGLGSLALTSRGVSFRQFSSLQSRATPILAVTANKNTKQTPSILIPSRTSSHGNHVQLWTAEKLLSGALIPIIPLAFVFPCNPMDYLLAFALTVHGHWGIEAIVVDYIRPSVFGELIPKISVALVYALSFLTLGGLFYFTYTDVGLVQAIKMLWKL